MFFFFDVRRRRFIPPPPPVFTPFSHAREKEWQKKRYSIIFVNCPGVGIIAYHVVRIESGKDDIEIWRAFRKRKKFGMRLSRESVQENCLCDKKVEAVDTNASIIV